jgi:hypothetical protein
MNPTEMITAYESLSIVIVCCLLFVLYQSTVLQGKVECNILFYCESDDEDGEK